MFKGLMLAAAAATVAVLFLAGTVSAQYPEPKGSLVCTTKVNAKSDGSAIYATLRDSKGSPVSGQVVTFTVISGSGSIDQNKTSTDENGIAWVKATGNVTVAATYDGLQCSSVAQVLGQTFHPPSTGDAGLAGGTGGGSGGALSSPVFAACLMVMGASGLALVVLRRRRLASVEA